MWSSLGSDNNYVKSQTIVEADGLGDKTIVYIYWNKN